jgi:hypothetical protein
MTTAAHLNSVNTGTGDNSGDGSTIRDAFTIVNNNVDKLNSQLNGSKSQSAAFPVTNITATEDISANAGAVYGLNIYGGVVFSRGSEVLTSSSGSWNGGNVSLYGVFSNTDPSTSTTTGVLQAWGGVGIRGNLNVGGTQNSIVGNLTVGGTLFAGNTSVGTLSASGATTVASLTVAGSTNLIGNTSVANISASGTTTLSAVQATNIVASTVSAPTGTFPTLNTTGTGTINSLVSTTGSINTLSVTSNAPSTSTNSGALTVVGGAGIGGNLYVGGTIYAANLVSTTTTELSITAPLLYLTADAPYPYDYDIGMYSHYIGGAGNVYQHTGVVRNHNDNNWYFFSNIPEPTGGTVNFNSSRLVYDGIKSGPITATGNITSTSSVVSTGAVYASTYLYANGAPYTGTYSNTNVQSYLTAGTNGITVPSINKSGTTGVGDIGSAVNTFGTVYAVASSAKYADLAENYVSDAAYPPGTVVEFGGDFEVKAGTENTTRVAGVVSTDPAYLMNSHCTGNAVVAVALMGRVPCRVTGSVRKGDMMVSAGRGLAKSSANPAMGSVIGKALGNFDGAEGIIEIVVGRL